DPKTGAPETPNDYFHPIYYSRPGDPTYNITCTGTCSFDNNGQPIAVPLQARPSNSRDAHMAVIDTSTGWEYDRYHAGARPAPNGTWTIENGAKISVTGSGIFNKPRPGSTTS